MSVIGFLYESAKDELRWANLDVKTHIHALMKIGEMIHTSDENFAGILSKYYTTETTNTQILNFFGKV